MREFEVSNEWSKAIDNATATLLNESGSKGELNEYIIKVHIGGTQPDETTTNFFNFYQGDTLNINEAKSVWVRKDDSNERKLVII